MLRFKTSFPRGNFVKFEDAVKGAPTPLEKGIGAPLHRPLEVGLCNQNVIADVRNSDDS